MEEKQGSPDRQIEKQGTKSYPSKFFGELLLEISDLWYDAQSRHQLVIKGPRTAQMFTNGVPLTSNDK